MDMKHVNVPECGAEMRESAAKIPPSKLQALASISDKNIVAFN